MTYNYWKTLGVLVVLSALFGGVVQAAPTPAPVQEPRMEVSRAVRATFQETGQDVKKSYAAMNQEVSAGMRQLLAEVRGSGPVVTRGLSSSTGR